MAASVSLAWDASPSDGVTEYIVKYGTSPGVYTAQESAGVALLKTISGLPDGFRYYFTVIARAGTTNSLDSNEVTSRPGITNPPVQIILQAEDAVLTTPMRIIDDITAMGRRCITTTNADDVGLATFKVVVPFVDEFIIWARVFSPTEGNDSFYVSHNNQPEDVYDTVRVATNVWQWTMINGRGGNDKPIELAHAIEPRTFIMFGTNQVDFRGRERGTMLDAILVTNDRNFVPGNPTAPSVPPPPTNLQLTVERRQ